MKEKKKKGVITFNLLPEYIKKLAKVSGSQCVPEATIMTNSLLYFFAEFGGKYNKFVVAYDKVSQIWGGGKSQKMFRAEKLIVNKMNDMEEETNVKAAKLQNFAIMRYLDMN